MDTNYAVAPGAYLLEWLEEEDITQQQLASRLGWSRKRVNEVVGGRAPVSADAAIMLERVTGIPTDSWLRFESAYRADLARLNEIESLAAHSGLVSPAVAKYLRTLEATTATKRNPAQLVSDFLAFHRCGTVAAYQDIVSDLYQGQFQLATLKDSGNSVDSDLLMAWIRAGELTESFEEARKANYDENALRSLLPALRIRAASPNQSMMTDFAERLSTVGVTLQTVSPPSPFPLHGLTRWLDERVPLIQQSGRRGTDGFIVWTLFHELGHILNDPRGQTHFEFTTDRKRNTHAERGANAFAMETLFGESGMSPFKGLDRDADIARVARDVGVAPGLAVFQMRRRRMLPYCHGHSLCVDL